ncbi:hypothetical protein C7M84_019370 [Penaeus vannamei]|uniref:Uncharacterized protein n=1 Tax=Penaeus vannamei TaxID=6689 RepID=A0A3R7LTX7_PENVA|nr:hypothetical protein C7M84_019370 [Penaeus vannamei]
MLNLFIFSFSSFVPPFFGFSSVLSHATLSSSSFPSLMLPPSHPLSSSLPSFLPPSLHALSLLRPLSWKATSPSQMMLVRMTIFRLTGPCVQRSWRHFLASGILFVWRAGFLVAPPLALAVSYPSFLFSFPSSLLPFPFLSFSIFPLSYLPLPPPHTVLSYSFSPPPLLSLFPTYFYILLPLPSPFPSFPHPPHTLFILLSLPFSPLPFPPHLSLSYIPFNHPSSPPLSRSPPLSLLSSPLLPPPFPLFNTFLSSFLSPPFSFPLYLSQPTHLLTPFPLPYTSLPTLLSNFLFLIIISTLPHLLPPPPFPLPSSLSPTILLYLSPLPPPSLPHILFYPPPPISLSLFSLQHLLPILSPPFLPLLHTYFYILFLLSLSLSLSTPFTYPLFPSLPPHSHNILFYPSSLFSLSRRLDEAPNRAPVCRIKAR